LYPGLDPESSSTEQRGISLLLSGDRLVIEDIKTSEVEFYEKISDVLALYRTLSATSGRFHLDAIHIE
jgi:hypothetical protein